MRTIGRMFWALAGLCAIAGPALAQQAPAALTVSVDEAAQLAIDHSPRVIEARARQTAAEHSVTALRALGFPTANLNAQYVRQNDVTEFRIPDGTGGSRVLYPNIPNVFKARAEVSVPIYSFGRIASNVAAADADVTAAIADRKAVEAGIRLDDARLQAPGHRARKRARPD
jgi:outer membrane protein TolC